jgi:sn-glycerol 3-phosphate transport system substrate-binding protein
MVEMKNKSWLVIFLITVIVLSACGGKTPVSPTPGSSSPNTGSSSPSAATPPAADQITLDFWYALSGGSGDAVKELVNRFNASQTGINVVAVYQGSYAEAIAKIDAAIAGNTVPNVVQVGAAPLLGSSEAILPITDFTQTDTSFQLDQIIPAFLDYNTAGGTLWSMPFNNSMPVLYYNKDLFTAAGLDPEAPPQNLDELLADAQKLTLDPDHTGTPSQWGLNFRDDTQWYLSSLFLENGGQIVSPDENQVLYNSPEAVAMLQLWGDWVTKYKVMPVNQHSEAQSDFLSGKLGMFIGSSALVTSLKAGASFNLGVAMFPAVGSSRVDPVGGGSLAIFSNKDARLVQASWEFVKYMVSKDSQIYLATQTGYLPIYKDAINWPEIQSLITTDPARKAAIQELQYAFAIPEFSALGDSDAALRKAVQQIELGASTPQKALDDAVTSVNQAIQRYK